LALGRAFFWVLWFCPVSIFPPLPRTYLSVTSTIWY